MPQSSVTTDGRTTRSIAQGLEALMMWSRRQTRPGGLSSTVFTTLDTLSFAGPMRVSDLAVRERVSQPGMTSLVNRLEAEGLAVRQADPSDGRAALVAVTDEGRERVAAYRRDRIASVATQLAQLSDAELAALEAAVPALDRLTSLPTTESSTTK
ncbi:MAG: MarR family winged helix-turn-helix transcriptional regulator [Jatrophihabitans sp.]